VPLTPLADAPPLRPGQWELLPIRFDRFDDDHVLVTNMVGEHAFLDPEVFRSVVDGTCGDQSVLAELRAKHMLRALGEMLPVQLLGMKLRTRTRRLASSTGLHIFVVSLRCEHTCRYCQVSRQTLSREDYDMTEETAMRGLDFAFRSPSSTLKIEFQGGEPLLNFPLIQRIVAEARRRNEAHGKDLAFVITSNLVLLDDEVLAFCKREDILLSTSLDGPAGLHNRNRPRPGGDSWQRATAGIQAARASLGPDRVSALMTTTERSLDQVHEIIDTYVDLGLTQVFLRPISPYGFARRPRSGAAYDVDRWLAFYEAGLRYVLDLNHRGIPMVETYAAIICTKMFSNDDPGYVDLSSPAGMGIGAIVYNYDGAVYASDEGRMLAEMGDTTFRLGDLAHDAYEDVMLGDALLDPLEQSFTQSVPMCSSCAYEPFCGADPVFHHATQGDAVGHKATSAFHHRNLGLFKLILKLYRDDPRARELFWQWAHR
jgi:uncharacterized protein